jgi:hypothetical protein
MQKPKTMRFFFISLFMVCFLFSGFTQVKREHFRGGMLLHAGYLSNNAGQTEINGMCTGIGGKIVFPIGKFLRVGTEGYVSNYSYKESNGFYKLGWGGLLTECQLSEKRFRPVIGVTVGGGRIRDLYPLSGDFTDNEADAAIYKDYSALIITPHISVEYGLTANLNIVAKIDYILYPGINYPTFIAHGPRMYIGILFSR